MYRIRTIFKTIKLWSSTMVLLGVSFYFFSCGGSDDSSTSTIQGEWYQESSIDAGARGNAVTFTLDGRVYICTGFNGNNGKVFLRDLWVYEAGIDTWVKKADLPLAADARSQAVAFTANGKGYIGLGFNGTKYLKDFWSYNPTTDEWTKIKDFPGAARIGALAFSVDNKGYVGTGKDDNLHYKDFYQYNDATDEWIQKPSVPKVERANAFSFVIDGKAYVGGGLNGAQLVQDFCEYDPIANSWTLKNDLLDDKLDDDKEDKGYTISREMAVTFVIEGKAYVVGGKRSSALNSETWEYNPSTDTWEKKNAFEGYPRFGAIGFSLDNFGYIGSGSYASNAYLNDKWKYDPTQEDE